MKKRNRNLLILFIIIVIAVTAWAIFFRKDATDENVNTNQAVTIEDEGKDSVIDTTALSGIDIEPDLDDVDYYIDDLTPPDTAIEIDFE